MLVLQPQSVQFNPFTAYTVLYPIWSYATYCTRLWEKLKEILFPRTQNCMYMTFML